MKKKMKIKGIHCASCKMLIEENLLDLTGVTSAKVDLKNNELTVEFDPESVSEKTIKEIIERDGYTVTN